MNAERFVCADCGWVWPYPPNPEAHAECDTCGGPLEPMGPTAGEKIAFGVEHPDGIVNEYEATRGNADGI